MATNAQDTKLTPLMSQYWSIKKDYPDTLLLFRMGDFYEMFGDDAKVGARALNITLTSRNHGKGSEDTPLAGFPYRQLENYMARLIKAGLRVAVCEQVEDPKLAKGLVKREVIEVASPGTILNNALLEDKRNIYLAGVAFDKKIAGFSYVDLSTGEFYVTEIPLERLRYEMERISPAEMVIPPDWYQQVNHLAFKDEFGQTTFTELDGWIFEYENAFDELTRHFKTLSLAGFGCDDMTAGINAAGAVLNYLKEMQKNTLNHITRLTRYFSDEYMVLDVQTRRNLELTMPLREGESREGTLLKVIDRTLTPAGGRLLRQWILHPLLKAPVIQRRLSAVDEMVQSGYLRADLQEELKDLNDLERLIARAALGKANARDLVALRLSLGQIPSFTEKLKNVAADLLTNILARLNPLPDLVELLQNAIKDDPPLAITEGGIIRKGFNTELDELRSLAFDGKSWIANLQNQERERTGISSLKVSYNKVFGYYIEISKAWKEAVPENYIIKQTLTNAERYITPELKEFETKILGAEEKINQLEYELFNELRNHTATFIREIQDNARALAELDVVCGLAAVALENNYIRPQIIDDTTLIINEGRHPVVEQLLPTGTFVPNDCEMDTESSQIWLITGPNMAGKSTYLRQIGLIVLLAQIGSFVPAKEAVIGVTDRIFTRVGAQDNLARGESTFLVEMNETANILNNATSRSLILLDEIGRGTSTFDGLSIAWAVTEFLHNNPRMQPKTLFATHYHELIKLSDLLERVKNYNVAVKEWNDDIVFLRKIVPGGSDRSYGIHVAQLAGLPGPVIVRANEVLDNLERNELTPNDEPKLAQGAHRPARKKVDANQLSLFAPAPEKVIVEKFIEHPLLDKLRRLEIDSLTPREALNMLYQLKDDLKASTAG